MEADTLDSKQKYSIEQLRQRLNTLKATLIQYQRHFTDPNVNPALIPSWPTITAMQKNIAAHLTTIQRQMSDTELKQVKGELIMIQSNNLTFLKEAHPHPTSQYPFGEQNALGLLMRKKLAPEITNWQRQMRNAGIAIEDDTICDVKGHEWDTCWNWAVTETFKLLRDSLEDDEDDEDDDSEDDDNQNEDEDEVAVVTETRKETVPAMALSSLMAFSSVGVIPPPKRIPNQAFMR